MKVYFQHTLETDDIVLRQDDTDNSDFYLENVGIYFPLIRIGERTIEFGDIVSMNFSVGKSFLPSVEITIDDSNFKFREELDLPNISWFTLFIGNPRDEKAIPIKNNYLILNYTSNPGSDFIRLIGQLWVPNIYQENNQSFENTSWEIIKQVAKECQLGFSSNISESRDEQIWIQNSSNFQFIKDLVLRSYISDDDTLICFVDQYANLNLISVKTALEIESPLTIDKNLITLEPLENPGNLVLSNNKLENNTGNLITRYTVVNNYADRSHQRSENTVIQFLDVDHQTVNQVTKVSGKEQLYQQDTYSYLNSVNVSEEYVKSLPINWHNTNLLQGKKMLINLWWAIHFLFIGANIKVDIYNVARRDSIVSQNPNQSFENQDEEGSDQRYQVSINPSLTGNYLILEIDYSYFRKTVETPDVLPKINQSLKLFKIQE